MLATIFTIWLLVGFRILYGACRNPDWTPEIGEKARAENNPIRSFLLALAFVAFSLLGPLLLAFGETRNMIKQNDPKLVQWLGLKDK